MTPAIKRLQRKLERAELELLRQHVLELAAKLEEAERARQIADDRAYNAGIVADMWHGIVMEQQEAAIDTPQDHSIGITRDGALHVINVPTPSEQVVGDPI